MTIRAVLFDLDETLLDRSGSLVAFLTDQHARFGRRLGNVSLERWRERFIALDDRGRVSKTDVYPAILEAFGGDAACASDLLADYQVNCSRHARPNPGMDDTLRSLRAGGFALGIVTNGHTDFQNRHIDALQLRPLVDAILVSEAEGLRKPDAALFHRAADRLGIKPAECLFVGDDPVSDVLGAYNAGLQTAWLHGGREWPKTAGPIPGAAIARLSQILELIEPARAR